ncbi:MAG: hypothetical protein JJ927_04415 [Balneola sp.]|nr:hypothetical protein [Balneola sp.]MBO6712164.1 hypothetical protein [Balneola sp.]MBO6871850.1 hypothetical protein [Balneola sp.]
MKEIKKQRESSYMPEPMFTKTYFNTYWANPEKGVPLYWSSKSIKKPPFNPRSFPSSRTYFDVQFNCVNVGTGVAKNVELVWDFDIKKFIEALEELDKEKIFRFTINGNEFIQIYSKVLDHLSIIRIEQSTPIEFKFILPFGISDSPSFVRVPIAYIELYSIFLYLFTHESSENSSINYEDIPPLKGRVSYYDIESELYCANFFASFGFSSLSGKVEGENWSKAAKIEVDFNEI